MLNKYRLAVERLVQRQFTSNRRHRSHLFRTHRVMPVVEASLLLRSLESVVNIAHIPKELGNKESRPGTFIGWPNLLSVQYWTGGRHHEENSLSDNRYSRIRCTFIRAGQNGRSSAAIRCFLVLPGSRYRDDEMSSCQYPACRWWQHEGYRCCSSDTGISTNSFDG